MLNNTKFKTRRSSWGKPQEAYRLQHNLSKRNLSQGGTPVLANEGYPSWDQWKYYGMEMGTLPRKDMGPV